MRIEGKWSWTRLSGAFAKLREATIGLVKSLCLSVRSCAWNYSSPTLWICMEIDICVFLENEFRKLKFH